MVSLDKVNAEIKKALQAEITNHTCPSCSEELLVIMTDVGDYIHVSAKCPNGHSLK